MDELQLRVYVGDHLAGHLIRAKETYVFEYLPEYNGPPVFLGWDLRQQYQKWQEFPPAFDGLLPEGVLLTPQTMLQT